MSAATECYREFGTDALRFRVFIDDNVLYARILSQAEELCGYGLIEGSRDGKYVIASCLHPGTYRFDDGRTMFFIRGWESKSDNEPLVCIFSSREEAEEACAALEEMCNGVAQVVNEVWEVSGATHDIRGWREK